MNDHILTVAVSTVIVAWIAWKLAVSFLRRPRQKQALMLPPDALLKPQPLLSEAELHLYNLIRMAVQDHYLVFARVPLWCLLHVEAEGKARLHLLRHLALKCADFALIHPGSREVEQIVQLEEGVQEEASDKARCREVQAAMQAAGIRVTTLPPQSRYTVQQLAYMLGVGEVE